MSDENNKMDGQAPPSMDEPQQVQQEQQPQQVQQQEEPFGGRGIMSIDESGILILRWMPTKNVRWAKGGVPEQEWVQGLINHEGAVVGYGEGVEWRPIQQEEI